MDIQKARTLLTKAFNDNSELELLSVLKAFPFLFYELYSRKLNASPCFCEVEFGNEYRCDFCWLNDNSDGPEWVLVEIEKPLMKCFTKKDCPSSELHHAIEQVKSWDRYFAENPSEKNRIFGAVKSFRFIIVAGSKEEWDDVAHLKWRAHNNRTTNIEIRTSDVFIRALEIAENNPSIVENFMIDKEVRKTRYLSDFLTNYDYFDKWRKLL